MESQPALILQTELAEKYLNLFSEKSGIVVELLKEVDATPNATSLTIECTNEDTKIGDLINKPMEYWYELELNNEYTILGYDESGAKQLILYPEGSKLQ